MRSAPAMPPRSAPLPEPALVMKNDIGCGGAAGGCCAFARYEPPASAIVKPIPNVRIILFMLNSSTPLRMPGHRPFSVLDWLKVLHFVVRFGEEAIPAL